jgi:uncharacterized RDD family membrane protein YckC
MSAGLHQPQAAASFPRRAVAAALDGAVLAIVVVSLHFAAALALGSVATRLTSAGEWHAFLLATVSLPCWIYYAALEASPRQATLGKRRLGIHVADVYGARIGVARSLVRTGVKLLPWELTHISLCYPEPVFVTGEIPMPRLLFGVYALGGVYVASSLMTLKKQSVHDLIAGTYVVRDDQGARAAPPASA